MPDPVLPELPTRGPYKIPFVDDIILQDFDRNSLTLDFGLNYDLTEAV